MKGFATFLVKLLAVVVCLDVLVYVGWGVIPVLLVMYIGYRLFTWGGKKMDRMKKESEAWKDFKNSRGL